MKLSFALALSLLLAITALAELPAGWNTNFVATLAEAKTNNRPALVFFTASWCGPCKMMVRSTLTNETVLKALEAFSHVAVDIDEQGPLARVHEISAVPTFKVLTPEGDAVASTSGFQTAEVFASWLTNAAADYTATVVRREEARRKLAEADTLLQKNDATSLNTSVTALFDLCTQRDAEMMRETLTRLASLAQRRPELLLSGLEHPKLAARIQAANLLRAKLGETFEADPWADAAMRQKFVAQWRDKLTSKKL